jgi:hypothetical protein
VERPLEQLCQRRTRACERQVQRRRAHPRASRVGAVGKAALSNGLLDWHFTFAEKPPGEWMSAHEQQMKDDDGETEGIMVGRSSDRREIAPQQLRGREELDTDAAGKARSITDLKGVAVDGGDRAVVAHPNVAVVDIANDEARLVNGGDEARDIGRHMNDEAIVGAREMPDAGAGAVKLVNAARIRNARHDEADGGARRVLEALGR